VFVLLARDRAAGAAVRFWIEERIRLGKNKRDDKQIEEAKTAADEMDRSWPWQQRVAELEKELARTKAALAEARQVGRLEYWSWAGDGYDHPESLTMPILIQPEALCKLLERGGSGEARTQP
jgi:hypothetical protein